MLESLPGRHCPSGLMFDTPVIVKKCQDNLVSKMAILFSSINFQQSICFSLLFRLWRRKVHLIWRSSVASAVFHLLAVLCFACWCWVFPWWWQNLMSWLPHQPIEHSFPKNQTFPQLTLYYGFSRTLSNYQDRKHRLTHTASGQFLFIRHQLLDVPSMSDFNLKAGVQNPVLMLHCLHEPSQRFPKKSFKKF